jgi:hypothetical protein
MRFEPNVGQSGAPVRYVARGAGYTVGLTANALILRLSRGSSGPSMRRDTQVQLRLLDANARPLMQAEQLEASVSHYLIGSDRSKWHRNVPNYRAVRYRQVYPGIDWVVHGDSGELEYDLLLAPGADARRIRFGIEGADGIALGRDGTLLIRVAGRTLRELKPVVYQRTASGETTLVQSHYVLEHGQLAFALGPYDRRRSLLIDPTLVYSTYLGGSGGIGDSVNAIAVDSAGDAYVAGVTASDDFPTASALQSSNHDQFALHQSAFVTKFKGDGSGLVYSTYLGGSGSLSINGDGASAIAVDQNGNVYVAGYTSSTDFPIANAFQAANHSTKGTNAFLAKIDPTGSTLVYSTYLGGSGSDWARALALDSSGEVYLAGTTSSADFPTVNPVQPASKVVSADTSTGFVAKFNAEASALVYSSYLGGNGQNTTGTVTTVGGDIANGIAVDSSGDAYVVGSTASTNFPTANALQATLSGYSSAFITELDASGALVFSTYLGGQFTAGNQCCGDTSAAAVALDGAGGVYVVGTTSAVDFPTANALQPMIGGPSSNAFVTKLNASGSSLVYSTYLGGNGNDAASSIAVDAAGNAYVAGSTTSTNFPLSGPVQAMNAAAGHAASNAFVSILNGEANSLVFSTYLGGSGVLSAIQPACVPCPPVYTGDGAAAVAVDSASNVYVAGSAFSRNFPTFAPFQATNRAGPAASDGFVAKISTQSTTPFVEITEPYRPSGGGGGGALGFGLISGLAGALVAQLRRRLRDSPRAARPPVW